MTLETIKLTVSFFLFPLTKVVSELHCVGIGHSVNGLRRRMSGLAISIPAIVMSME